MRRGSILALLALVACNGERTGDSTESGAQTTLRRLRAIPELAAQLRPSLRLERRDDSGYRLAHASWLTAAPALAATIPTRSGALHLALEARPDFFIDVSADDDPVEGRAVDGAVVFENVRTETDLVHALAPQGAEELRVLRTIAAPHTLRWTIAKGPAVSAIRVRDGRIEVLDAEGVARITSQPMFAVDARGRRRDLALHEATGAGESFAVETEIPTTLPHPVVVDPLWNAAGNMGTRREYHMIARLPGGRVLVAGGYNGTADVATAEIFSESTKMWAPTNPMSKSRHYGVATALLDGRVVVVGGGIGDVTKTAEIFDPSNNTWSGISTALTDRRAGMTATLLGDGRVLVVGGDNAGGNAWATADLYDPGTNAWAPTGSMATERGLHTATLLSDGRVLVAGGGDDSETFSTAEIYDPANGTFTATGPMSVRRREHAATRLADGRVLVCGGECIQSPCTVAGYATCERWSPTTNSWTSAGSMSSMRAEFAMLTVSGGRVIAAGGETPAVERLSTADVYDPSANTWSPTDNMVNARVGPAAILLGTGEMLITGGRQGSTSVSSTAEIHAPLPAVDGGVADAATPADSAVADSAVADTAVADGALATDTSVATMDASAADSRPLDGTVADAGDEAGGPDATLDTSDETAGDTQTIEETAATDANVADAPGADAVGGACSANTDCPNDQYCAASQCVPREPRGDAPCGCSVPGADGTDGRARATFALAALCAALHARRRRRVG